MSSPNEFQKANLTLFQAIGQYATLADQYLKPIGIFLAQMAVNLLALGFMLASSIPIFYLLMNLVSGTFDFLQFLKYVVIGLSCWYLGFGLGQTLKFGEEAKNHLGYRED